MSTLPMLRLESSRKRRSPLDELLFGGMAQSTIGRYNAAIDHFIEWLKGSNPIFARFYPHFPIDKVDPSLTDYLLFLHTSGHGRAAANSVVYGLIAAYPQLSSRLLISRRCLKGFNKLRPSVQRPPLSWGLTVVISLWLAKRYGRSFAVATLLAFDCLLRLEELCEIQLRHVALPGDPRVGIASTSARIRLARTKTGLNQSVVVLNRDVNSLLNEQVARRAGRKHLWAFTSPQYYRAFKNACVALNLSPRYSPHSLRHGGATHCLLLGWKIPDIQQRGRWASTESLRRYCQSFEAVMLSVDVPSKVARLAASVQDRPMAALKLIRPIKRS